MIHVCDNCGAEFGDGFLKVNLAEIPDLNQRLDPGSVVPSGECNECHALVYPEPDARVEGELPPDPDEMNDQRSAWADDALAIFMRETRHGKEEGVEALEEALTDLLTNFYHFADRHGIEMRSCLRLAAGQYREEISDGKEEDEGAD